MIFTPFNDRCRLLNRTHCKGFRHKNLVHFTEYMLGLYMQRSWIIPLCMACSLSLLYVFATPLLVLIEQEKEIAELAGTFALWMLPQLFAYAMVFPLAKFLQAQSKVMVMAIIAVCALVLHVVLSWILIFKVGWGLLKLLLLDVRW